MTVVCRLESECPSRAWCRHAQPHVPRPNAFTARTCQDDWHCPFRFDPGAKDILTQCHSTERKES